MAQASPTHSPDPSRIAEVLAGKAPLGVLGLGYVGLPVATAFAAAGLRVVGVDRDAARVATIAAGRCPIEGREPGLAELLGSVFTGGALLAHAEASALAEAGVVLVCVETPVEADHRPRYDALRAALTALGPVLREGALVIVESTLAPGTMRTLVIPTLEAATGGALHQRFHVGHCPERVMPGRLLANLRTMARACGGSSAAVAQAMTSLYGRIVDAELDATDLTTAELVKTAENAYRDVNIAFANELALICEGAGADFAEVRRLVNKSPGRTVLQAGAGVGGHCIPKDSWLLAAGAPEVEPWLLAAARARNESMPAHVLALLQRSLDAHGVALRGARVCVLGYAYLEDSDDTRDTPSARLVQLAEAAGVQLRIHDPFVHDHQGDWRERCADADAAVLMVAHGEYRDLDLGALAQQLKHPVLIDGRQVFSAEAAARAGLTYARVGLGAAPSTEETS